MIRLGGIKNLILCASASLRQSFYQHFKLGQPVQSPRLVPTLRAALIKG